MLARLNTMKFARYKLPLLTEAARNFLQRAQGNARGRFDGFCGEMPGGWKISSCSMLCASATANKPGITGRASWRAASRRDASPRASELASEMAVRRAIQFIFYEQWRALRQYCAQRSIRVVGDIAIFVDYDSADVWAHRDLYHLKRRSASLPSFPAFLPMLLAPPASAGAILCTTGMPREPRAIEWWIQRLRWATQTCDYIRLDHFRGFDQFWEIPASEPTAMHGRWVDGPKDELFNKIREALGGLPFFAEDLGYITPEVHALRERHQIPGLAVLQFGFRRSRRPHLSAAPRHRRSRDLHRHARQ